MSEIMIQPELLPKHVVIIPDGNRRFATARGQKPWEGHEAGAKNTESLVREARRLGVQEISFWGSSIENLTKRPLPESQALLRIYEQYFTELLEGEDIYKDKVKVRFIGHWEEQFPSSLKNILYKILEATKDHDQCFLNFFLAYSGDDDMKQAIQHIADTVPEGTKITDEMIKGALMTRDLPPVDLLIRTGGEPHLSAGFMMWDIANSQLYFSEKLYPDFDVTALGEAILDYSNRGRRYGK
ncbi:MAG: polyprenyl diphosphate synthase [Patescibacteria group bacterium]